MNLVYLFSNKVQCRAEEQNDERALVNNMKQNAVMKLELGF